MINSLDEVIQKIKSELLKPSPSKELKGGEPSPFSELGAVGSPFRGLGGLTSGGLNTELQTLTTHLFNKTILLDLIVNYTVFEEEEQKDEKS